MNPKEITMYEISPKNYKKSGTLKKSAKAEYSLHNAQTMSQKDIAESITRYMHVESVESPYFFTHIRLHADGKQYAIYQRVYVAGQYFMTSPTELLKALQSLAN